MSFKVGIGIITFNRKDVLRNTIDQVRALTRQSNAALAVADDGSSDGTLAMLRDLQVPVITGVNMGIAWNKNRALFLLSQKLRCETVILMEDDTIPVRSGWETEWIYAAQRWGHVNYAADWIKDHIFSGAGTAADPARSRTITAQCAAYSNAALTYGGYFDSRFHGYGHEHVEHSRRLVRVGYGGTEERHDGEEIVTYLLLTGDLTVIQTKSFQDVVQEQKNWHLAQDLMREDGYRAPWRGDGEMRQFRAETESAMTQGTDRFRLTPAEPGAPQTIVADRGFFSRLLHGS